MSVVLQGPIGNQNVIAAAAVRAIERRRIRVDGPAELLAALAGRLRCPHPDYAKAVQYGYRTRGLPRVIDYTERMGDGSLIIPRGAVDVLREERATRHLALSIDDWTVAVAPVSFPGCPDLSPMQRSAVEKVCRHGKGTLAAPTGAGKTRMALEVIRRRQQPVLWLVHTAALATQAKQAAVQAVGLDPAEIGMVGGGRRVIGERFTVGMLQTLTREIPADLLTHIGHVVVDEAHHVPAESVTRVVSQFPARYLLGLSATPYRQDPLGPAIFWHPT